MYARNQDDCNNSGTCVSNLQHSKCTNSTIARDAPGTHLRIVRWPTVLSCFVHLRTRISAIGTLGAPDGSSAATAAAVTPRRRDMLLQKWCSNVAQMEIGELFRFVYIR